MNVHTKFASFVIIVHVAWNITRRQGHIKSSSSFMPLTIMWLALADYQVWATAHIWQILRHRLNHAKTVRYPTGRSVHKTNKLYATTKLTFLLFLQKPAQAQRTAKVVMWICGWNYNSIFTAGGNKRNLSIQDGTNLKRDMETCHNQYVMLARHQQWWHVTAKHHMKSPRMPWCQCQY